MGEQVTVRRATAADRQSVGRLWLEMMEFHRECDPHFFQLKPDALEIWLRHLDECLIDEEQIVLVAQAEDELVGFAMGRPNEDPPPFATAPHGFVTNLSVSERWRGKGVGRQLYAALARELQARGLQEIRLSASALNPVSNAFWRRLGFEPYVVQMRKAAE